MSGPETLFLVSIGCLLAGLVCFFLAFRLLRDTEEIRDEANALNRDTEQMLDEIKTNP